jgi:predicted metal-dependent peptidase
VHVVYCDAEIQGVDVFERGEPVAVSPKGFGGTDFRPVFVNCKLRSIVSAAMCLARYTAEEMASASSRTRKKVAAPYATPAEFIQTALPH